ncbi:hypothetical protein CS542_05600 [Pedobacter sp. IW39]|nr:hypothetical protein CS542_05600 [Pedobacter sp. IW39]
MQFAIALICRMDNNQITTKQKATHIYSWCGFALSLHHGAFAKERLHLNDGNLGLLLLLLNW